MLVLVLGTCCVLGAGTCGFTCIYTYIYIHIYIYIYIYIFICLYVYYRLASASHAHRAAGPGGALPWVLMGTSAGRWWGTPMGTGWPLPRAPIGPSPGPLWAPSLGPWRGPWALWGALQIQTNRIFNVRRRAPSQNESFVAEESHFLCPETSQMPK